MDNNVIVKSIPIEGTKKIKFIPNKGIHYGNTSINVHRLFEHILLALGIVIE